MAEITERGHLPDDLYTLLKGQNYRLWRAGVPLKEAIEEGKRTIAKYLEEKSAGKSGG